MQNFYQVSKKIYAPVVQSIRTAQLPLSGPVSFPESVGAGLEHHVSSNLPGIC